MKSLFGEEIPENPPRMFYGKFQHVKNLFGYRKGNLNKCRDCRHLATEGHHNRKFYKCMLMGTSRSPASDVRLSYGCNKFKAKARPQDVSNNKATRLI